MMYEELSETDRKALTRGHCPICNGRGFVLGPKGGMSTNIECANLGCRMRFNVVNYGGEILFAQHIQSEAEGGPKWPTTTAGET
jgi:hypothetical protein